MAGVLKIARAAAAEGRTATSDAHPPDGGRRNYDDAGTNASHNDTVRVFI